MDIRVFIRLHELINYKQTGNLKQLAQKLEISERSVNYYIAFMRNELKAPIVYNRKLETYLYETECKLCFVGK
jgi:transcriptional antiterminator